MDIKYRCDKCKHIFVGKEVVLKPITKNINIIGMSIIGKNKITGKNFQAPLDKTIKGDCTLHCPKCEEIHLFGFDSV